MKVKKKALEKEKYQVLFGYRDPSTRRWHKVGDTVTLSKPQAEPLLLGAKPRIKKTMTKLVATNKVAVTETNK
ncbi:hypothetical protein CGH51_06820 [Vibrio parahaemolyticus]|uniref:hypothetical protein n=1 Tax=Vibrio parahaemolyticus TaxID=670 RepID=UPI0011201A95|nr:hypothetical protein [Vibrio parahaemolyticus]EHK7404414.1 hypothetical protein [Vibrio parahaemolyticus]MDG2639244.1 hypothetical protein [Vibrio parahaemolyticus]TOK10850.1 hypothetical protein CGI25_07650 [Vibrio parahaemolyticus]TON76102.1 hypothetical protein CGH51_06820 [Vibrio parahaemolyticus]